MIVPVYNVEKYIGECLDSLLSQTYPDIEVVAVVDASPDKSLEIIRGKQKDFTGGKSLVIKDLKENLGSGAVRDIGIAMATGKYIFILDSDDYIHPLTIGKCVEAMQEADADLVEVGFRMTKQRPGDMPFEDLAEPRKVTVEDKAEIEKRTEHVSWGKLYKKEMIERLGLKMRYRCFEDTLFTRLYALNSRRAVFIESPFYFYYQNPASLTSTMSASKILLSMERAKEVEEAYKEFGLEERAGEYRRASGLSLRKFLLKAGGEKIEIPDRSKVWEESCRIVDRYNQNKLLFKIETYRKLGLKFTAKRLLAKLRLR